MRCYHRETGTAIDLAKYPLGSPEFLKECERFKKPEKTRSGTWGALVSEYKASPSYATLRANTQKFYGSALNYLAMFDQVSVEEFNRAAIVKIRDKAHAEKGWHFANSVQTTLSAVFSWGVERGYPQTNAAAGIKKISRPKDLERANRPWTDAERFAVLDNCPPQIKAPIALMMYIGCDPADAIAMLKTQYDGVAITYKRMKTGESVWRKAPKALQDILRNEKHKAPTLTANIAGDPWTRGGFNSVWMPFKAKLLKQGQIGPGLTLKGLRHTSATIMAEMGYDDKTIAVAHGQQTEGMARWYSRDADRKGQMEDVAKAQNAEEKRRKMSNQARKVSNLKRGQR